MTLDFVSLKSQNMIQIYDFEMAVKKKKKRYLQIFTRSRFIKEK